MPFVEIGKNIDWVYIQPRMITICASLRNKYNLNERKFKFFYDEENNLFAIQPNNIGYGIREGRIHTRKIPRLVQKGRFEAEWDGEKVIVDFSRKISDN